jgi:NhaA family Na+:H+ antiporter
MKKKSGGKKVINLFQQFISGEESSGVILIFATIVSLILANSAFGHTWIHFWHYEFGPESIGLKLKADHWINDGLMAVFFLYVGLEIKREIIEGELSSIKKSFLPIFAAVGGMIVPALIYAVFNFNTPLRSGCGVPMATDIAFAIGILALLGNRVPFSLKVMLTALAIVDDLGAIIVIAIFYTSDLNEMNIAIALGIIGLLALMNRMGVKSLPLYLFIGLFLWYFTLKSGVHATIAGVALAMTLPLGKGRQDSSAEHLLHSLIKPVNFFIMPVFALANTGFVLPESVLEVFSSSASIGIMLGLYLGKPIGIASFSYISVKLGLSNLPAGSNWKQIIGVGFLGGIGFTMSIFIALLAFNDESVQDFAKFSVLSGSLIAGITGYLILRFIGESEKLKA